VTEGRSDPIAPRRGASWWLARAIVWLRFLIVPAWVAGVLVAAGNLPAAFESDSSQLGNLLPSSSRALEVEREAVDRFGLPLLSRTIVVAREPGGFSPRQSAAALRYVAAVDRRRGGDVHAVPITDAPDLLAARRLGSTLVVYLYPDPSLSEADTRDAAAGFAAGLRRVTGVPATELTGALPANLTETELIEDNLLWVELATVAVVVLVLALYFRSLGIPLLGVGAVAIAYELTDHALGWLGPRLDVSIPSAVEPVIVALLFGTLTDYLVFFASGYRERVLAGERSHQAATATAAELLPVIATAALMIAGAMLTLLLSGVRFLAAFGPAMAVAVLIGALVAMTFVPAVLAILGRALLWPGSRAARGEPPADERPAEARRAPRGRLIGLAARHPLPIALIGLVALAAAASGLRLLELGNSVVSGLPASTSAHRGYEQVRGSIGPGAVGPTMLVVEGEGVAARSEELAALQAELRRQPGVDGVIGPRQELPGGPYGAFLSPDGDAARYAVVFDSDPDGAGAMSSLEALEDQLPSLLSRSGLAGAAAAATGDTSIAAELTEDTSEALLRVAPAVIAVLLTMLWLLLRSWRAPLYLVAVSALVVAAALGLTVYVFQGLLGYEQLAFFVPVATAILLLALGSDYNVFLVSRIWNEADRHGLRRAIAVAGSGASRAITVAGLVLALSFAAVALIPLQSFRELAFAMAVGLLLDTLLARTLLVPALVSLFEREEEPATPPAREREAAGVSGPEPVGNRIGEPDSK
jgi:RND superfamily putative drug exporter